MILKYLMRRTLTIVLKQQLKQNCLARFSIIMIFKEELFVNVLFALQIKAEICTIVVSMPNSLKTMFPSEGSF